MRQQNKKQKNKYSLLLPVHQRLLHNSVLYLESTSSEGCFVVSVSAISTRFLAVRYQWLGIHVISTFWPQTVLFNDLEAFHFEKRLKPAKKTVLSLFFNNNASLSVFFWFCFPVPTSTQASPNTLTRQKFEHSYAGGEKRSQPSPSFWSTTRPAQLQKQRSSQHLHLQPVTNCHHMGTYYPRSTSISRTTTSTLSPRQDIRIIAAPLN